MPQIDLSNPLLWIVVALSVFTLLHLAVTGAMGLGLLIVVIKKAKADLHAWAAALSKWLTGLGFSATITAPLDAIAQGDVPTALADGGALIKYLLNPTNAATEWSAVLRKLWGDPTSGPIVQQVVTDLQGGASQQQLASDLAPGIAALRSNVPKGPIATGIAKIQSVGQDLVAHLPALASNPQLLSLANLLHVNGQADQIPALLAGHAVAGAAVGSLAGPAGTVAGTAAGAASVLVPAGMKAVLAPLDHVVTATPPAPASQPSGGTATVEKPAPAQAA